MADFDIDSLDLKTLKAADLLSLMLGTMGSLGHKVDCDIKLLKGVCSCGLDKARIDTANLMKKLMEAKADGETKV